MVTCPVLQPVRATFCSRTTPASPLCPCWRLLLEGLLSLTLSQSRQAYKAPSVDGVKLRKNGIHLSSQWKVNTVTKEGETLPVCDPLAIQPEASEGPRASPLSRLPKVSYSMTCKITLSLDLKPL